MNLLCNAIAYDYAFANEHWYKFIRMCSTAVAAMDAVAVTIPKMTSATTPSGEASNPGAFDKILNVDVYPNVEGAVWYRFEEPVDIYKVVLTTNIADNGYGRPSTGYFAVSEDGGQYETVLNFSNLAVASTHAFVLKEPKRVKYVKCVLTAHNNGYGGGSTRLTEMDAYGKAVEE